MSASVCIPPFQQRHSPPPGNTWDAFREQVSPMAEMIIPQCPVPKNQQNRLQAPDGYTLLRPPHQKPSTPARKTPRRTTLAPSITIEESPSPTPRQQQDGRESARTEPGPTTSPQHDRHITTLADNEPAATNAVTTTNPVATHTYRSAFTKLRPLVDSESHPRDVEMRRSDSRPAQAGG